MRTNEESSAKSAAKAVDSDLRLKSLKESELTLLKITVGEGKG